MALREKHLEVIKAGKFYGVEIPDGQTEVEG
jgi:hypothetical protein